MIELPFAPGLGLDLSLPDGPLRGLVAYAHGGSFEGGSRRDWLAAHLPDLFLPRGIGFASISYRLRGQPAFPTWIRPMWQPVRCTGRLSSTPSCARACSGPTSTVPFRIFNAPLTACASAVPRTRSSSRQW